jgi:hypothetical protein
VEKVYVLSDKVPDISQVVSGEVTLHTFVLAEALPILYSVAFRDEGLNSNVLPVISSFLE